MIYNCDHGRYDTDELCSVGSRTWNVQVGEIVETLYMEYNDDYVIETIRKILNCPGPGCIRVEHSIAPIADVDAKNWIMEGEARLYESRQD